MRRYRSTALRWTLVVFGVSVVGCGAKTGLEIPEPGPEDGSVDADASIPDVSIDVSLPDVVVPECTVFGATAELLPLDVFMLFDASGSMQELTASGDTKWSAVRNAIAGFFDAPDSEGIGVALTFFPQVQAELPLFCTEDRACGQPGACGDARACLEAGILCNSDDDCAVLGFPDDRCVLLGFCEGLGVDNSACTFDGAFPCPAGTGPCLQRGVCENRDTCPAAAYATPVAGPDRLPESAGMLLASYDAEELPRAMAGGTPTLPALSGTVDGAIAWARANPSHKAVIVLATDGFPTSCDPTLAMSLEAGVDNVAEAAVRGVAEANIETFVIGVFAPDEQAFAQTNLDRIASGGGTESAFLVNTAGEVSREFLEALNQVRLDATACDFALSEPIELTGEPVLARITRDGNQFWLPDVGGPNGCAGGGFYFPEAGEVAARLALCPESCALLGASPERELEVFTTCSGDPRER
ncbi:MAG: vWA domain-containing protein [Myxococcota bacterium]